MLTKVFVCIILYYFLPPFEASFCPLDSHVVCNRNKDEHRCTCGAAKEASDPVPEASCTLLIETKSNEFEAVSVTFDLAALNEKREEDRESQREESRKKLREKHRDKRSKHHDDKDKDEDDDEKSDESSQEDDEEDEKFYSDLFPQEKFRQDISSTLGADDDKIVILRIGCNEAEDELTVQFGILKESVVKEREEESKEKELKRKLKAEEKSKAKDDDDNDDNEDDDEENDKSKDDDDKDDKENEKKKKERDDSDEDEDEDEEKDDEFEKYEQGDFENVDTIVNRLKEKGKDDELAGLKVDRIEKVEKLLLLEGVISNTLLLIMALVCLVFVILTCICGCYRAFCTHADEEHNPELDKLNNV